MATMAFRDEESIQALIAQRQFGMNFHHQVYPIVQVNLIFRFLTKMTGNWQLILLFIRNPVKPPQQQHQAAKRADH